MSRWLGKILVFFKTHPFVLIPPLFYGYTCCTTIGLGDTALTIEGIKYLKINTHANNHNITVIFGWLFSHLPGNNIAYKANLTSVFLGSCAVFFFYRVLLQHFRSKITAVVTASLFMVSHSLWWHSTIIEVYAANAFFTAWFLYLLCRLQETKQDKYLYWLFFVCGLSIFNHIQMGALSFGAAAALIWIMISDWRKGIRRALISTACYLTGFMPYLLAFLNDVAKTHNFHHVFHWALGGDFQGIMFKGTWDYALRDFGILVINQFPSFFLLCIPAGLFFLARRWKFSAATAGLAVAFGVNSGFFMFYNTWDKYAFLLPSFTILAFTGGFAVDALVQWLKKSQRKWLWALACFLYVVSLAAPVTVYAHLTQWAERRLFPFWTGRYSNWYTENSHRIGEYLANPNKRHFRDIEEFADLVFSKFPPNSILFDDDSRTYYPLAEYFQRYYLKRPDIRTYLVNSWGFKNWGASESVFADELRSAYNTGRPFFLIALKHPFTGLLKAMPDGRRYRFDTFRLDEKHWVYRLVTAKEAGDAAHAVKNIWQAYAADGNIEIDVLREHALYVKNGTLIEQDMSTFSGQWKNNNHLLLSGADHGAEFAVLIRLKQPALAHLTLTMTAANDFGLAEIYLNGKKIQEAVDFYAPEVLTRKILIPEAAFSKGINLLAFKNTGKNFKSKGYYLGLDTILIEPFGTAQDEI